MNAIRYLIHGAVAILVAAGAPAWSLGLDAYTLKAYGGTYMVDCRNPASPKVTVLADTLVFLDGNKRITGSSVETVASYFEPSRPKGFQFALLPQASTPSGLDMAWLVYEDKSGMYLTIDMDRDPKVLAAIGKPLAGKKFRRCDGAPTQAAAVPVPRRTYALHELSAAGILLDPKARTAYYKALGPLRREPWLADLDGPSSENKQVTVAGAEYVFAYSCKNHDCYDNNTVLMYSAGQNVVYGKVYQRGKSTLIGAPPPAVASALERLWWGHFRSNPQ